MTARVEPRAKILVVDDRPENLVAMEAVLAPLDQDVVTARSGDEALRRLLDQDFAVVLLDVLMPGMDGFATAALVRERARTRHVPIIFLTAVSHQDEYVARGYTLGAVDYLAKPFHPDILRAKVAVFVELYKKNEQVREQAALLQQNEQRERERAVEEVRRLGEKRYQDLAESMPAIVWTATPDGNATYWNTRWYDYVGVAPDSPDARDWRRVIHLDDLAPMVTAWRTARESRAPFELSVRFRRGKDGAFRWHLVRAVPTRDASGDVTEWVLTSTDIDDRVRTELGVQFLADASKILAESLEYQRTVTEAVELAARAIADWCVVEVAEVDGAAPWMAAAGRVADETAVARRQMNAQEPDLAPLFRPGSPEGESAVVAKVERGDSLGREPVAGLRLLEVVRVPLVLRGERIGSLRLASTDPARLFGAFELAIAEDFARRLCASIDNARLFQVAQSERTALEAAARTKDEFLAVLSHELRSPLQTTVGWSQMLRSGRLDPKTFEVAVDAIERSARAQERLVGDLLDVSSIVTGKLRLQIAELDLAAVVRASVEAIRPTAEAKNISLDVTVPDVPATFRGDAQRLHQIAWNLLANAMKFTGRNGHVGVSLRQVGDDWQISVADDGAGIEPDFLPFVFERFRQANSTMRRAHGGLGLGLSIVRHLTELHGGTCRAASDGIGHGATMTISLPADVVSQEARATAAGRDRQDLEGIHILVVDDSPDGRDLFEAMLQYYGAHVRTAGSVAEALADLAQHPPDVLVSDIGLPGQNGYDLIREVRASEAKSGKKLPALALTAYASDSDRRAALEAGFQLHLAKPIESEVLSKAIGSLLSRR